MARAGRWKERSCAGIRLTEITRLLSSLVNSVIGPVDFLENIQIEEFRFQIIWFGFGFNCWN